MATKDIESGLSDQVLICDERDLVRAFTFISDLAVEEVVRRLLAAVDGDFELEPYREGKTDHIKARAWDASIYMSVDSFYSKTVPMLADEHGTSARKISHIYGARRCMNVILIEKAMFAALTAEVVYFSEDIGRQLLAS